MFLDSSKPGAMVMGELGKVIMKYDKEKLMVFLLAMSYKLEKPSGVILVGPSSAGKSYLLNNVMRYFPLTHDIEEAKKKNWGLLLTGLSKKVLNYYVPPGGSWNHKLLCIQELDGAAEASAVIRTFISEGMASTLVTEESKGRHFAASFTVKGRPAFFVTTANDELESQFSNRLNVIEVSGEFAREVMRFEGARMAAGKEPEFDMRLRDEIEALPNEADIYVPYAPRLAEFWYDDTVIAQRSFPEFLKLIQCSCLLHSKFRKRIGGMLVANLDDYEIARRIAKISKFKLGAGLLRAYKRIISALRGLDKKYMHYLKDGSEVRGITREQLAELVERSTVQIDRYLEKLCDLGIFRTHLRYVENDDDSYLKPGRNPNVYTLSLKTEEDMAFPSSKVLLNMPDADLTKLNFIRDGIHWKVSGKKGVPLTHHAYNPLTGNDIDINADETVYMVERKVELVQSALKAGEQNQPPGL